MNFQDYLVVMVNKRGIRPLSVARRAPLREIPGTAARAQHRTLAAQTDQRHRLLTDG